jgi:arabinogalactan oligomer/maltooligosaccharide transport system substrate-binding protein
MYPLQTSMGNTGFALNDAGGWDTTSIDSITIDDEAGMAFAEKIAELGDLGILNAELTSDVAIEKFTTGAAPYMITGPWFLNAIKESGMNYSIDPIPPLGPESAKPFVGVIGLYLCSQAKNPLAATDFLVNFMTTDEAALEVYRSGGKPPALLSTVEAVSDDVDVAAWAEAGTEGIPLPNTAAAGAYWQTVGRIQQAILRDQGEPAELWAQLGEDMRARYEELTAN